MDVTYHIRRATAFLNLNLILDSHYYSANRIFLISIATQDG